MQIHPPIHLETLLRPAVVPLYGLDLACFRAFSAFASAGLPVTEKRETNGWLNTGQHTQGGAQAHHVQRTSGQNTGRERASWKMTSQVRNVYHRVRVQRLILDINAPSS